MPVGPRPINVQFNYLAAAAARDAVENMRTRLFWGWASTEAAATTAQTEWLGRAATNFAATHLDHRAAVQELNRQLIALEESLSTAIDSAWWEQGRRRAAQQAWDDQRAAELLETDKVLG